MEELFKINPLEGKYKEAFEEAKEILGIDGKEAEAMELIIGLVQSIVTVEKLPLEVEKASLEVKLKSALEDARRYKAKANALEEANKELLNENETLRNSLKALKDLSIAEDRIKAVNPKTVTLEFRR